jgi:solute:Na+ symporter, SSS family
MDFSGLLQQTNFTTFDWVIVTIYPLLSVVLGIIASRFIADMDDFVVAGRGIRTALGIATLTGTELGLVTVMYSAQKGFTGGFAAFHIGLAAGVVTFFVGLSGFIIAGLRRQEVLTIPEFYGRRYSRGVRIFGGLVLSFGGILNMGMFLKAGSIFIVGITGMDPESNALLIVMFILLVLVLFYTILGGMISVVIADYLQFVVLSFGLLMATVLAIRKLGWGNIFETIINTKGEAGFNPFVAEGAFGPDYVIWMLFLGLVSCALWPTSVARALAAHSEQTVKRQFMFASASYAIRNIVPYFWGIAAFVLVMQTPALKDAFLPGEAGAESLDSLYALPVFMGRLLPAGLVGILTAAMIAAFMSTHDSYFLCWSSVLTNDVVVPIFGELTQKQRVLMTRFIILLIGIVIFLVSFAFPLREDLWDYMAVTGAIYFSGAFALLVGGLYWKGASNVGAYCALVAGCSAVFGLGAIQRFVLITMLGFDNSILETVTGARVGIFTIVLTMFAMVFGSLLFPDNTDNTPPAEAEA